MCLSLSTHRMIFSTLPQTHSICQVFLFSVYKMTYIYDDFSCCQSEISRLSSKRRETTTSLNMNAREAIRDLTSIPFAQAFRNKNTQSEYTSQPVEHTQHTTAQFLVLQTFHVGTTSMTRRREEYTEYKKCWTESSKSPLRTKNTKLENPSSYHVHCTLATQITCWETTTTTTTMRWVPSFVNNMRTWIVAFQQAERERFKITFYYNFSTVELWLWVRADL